MDPIFVGFFFSPLFFYVMVLGFELGLELCQAGAFAT
jgi:hypothetical protein